MGDVNCALWENTMKFLSKLTSLALTIVLAAAPAFSYNQVKIKAKQHSAMHVIVMIQRDIDGKSLHGGLCTAYAVGPHTLLTAEHCNIPETNAVYLDNEDHDAIKNNKVMSYTIISRTFDHQDHMLLDISAVNFPDTITLSASVRTAKQGEKVYFWGTPNGVPNQYREGYVMGTMPTPKPDPEDQDSEKVDATATLTLAAMPTIGGDSGSAVFAEKDGQLVGIVTFGFADGQVMGMFPIQFTQAQIATSMQ